MGGRQRCDELNRVSTNWTGLPPDVVQGLEQHGRWQLLAAHAIYGALEDARPGLQSPPS
jgi:hypothetical protein